MVTKIESGIHDAVEESRKIRTDIHSKTSAEKDSILKVADTEAKKVIKESQDSLAKELEQEVQKIPQIVSKLSSDVYTKILN